MNIRAKLSLWILVLACCTFPSFAQQANLKLNTAYEHLNQKQEEWQLLPTDLQDVIVSDQYDTKHNGVRHIYFNQRYDGIEIFNAVAGVHLNKDGEVAYSTNRFYGKLSERVSSSRAVLTAATALSATAKELNLPIPQVPQVLSRSNNTTTFVDPAISRSPIPSKLIYFPMDDGSLQLCWNLFVEDPRGAEGWNVFINALDGSLVSKSDQTIYCNFPHEHGDDCSDHLAPKQNLRKNISGLSMRANDGAVYNVFPAPAESPNHGERIMLVDPADPVASPFGWHDTNGRTGPEYTITRGNNVHAYRDAIPDNLPDTLEPDGGPELIFDFPYTVGGNPDDNSDATITQLFYMNNFMHDWTYYYGFDELSGNFQQNNYNNGGNQGDPVNAEAQDGSGLNNANFLTRPDGTNSRMQMFLFSSASANFNVLEPSDLARSYGFTTASFGPQIFSPIEGELVEGLSFDPNQNVGCSDIFNTQDVAGNIVLIDRGECVFETKAKNAEAAGAILCVICNNAPGTVIPGNIDTIPDPSIPTIAISQADCALFRQSLQSGNTVNVRIIPPDFLDSGQDNGIIAHEYGHGISNRLTGGPANASCLFNNEQMGEGWSDFFALVTTVSEGDIGTTPRGIGTFSLGQQTAGRGFRRQRYSTDFNENNQTYDDVIGTGAPHPLGEVWASTLWDIYWSLSDLYGFSEDPSDRSAGNNIAVQLVMDGMKLQECRPGFINGRDGIIAADFINNGGANECLLWEIFARRGLGWNAIQGQSNTRNDNIEAFDLRPECVRELKVSKSSTPNIQPGENFTVTIDVNNDKASAVSEVIISDAIPFGATYVAGSVSGAQEPLIQGDVLIFELGNIPAGGIRQLTFELESDPTIFSTSIFEDDVESGRSNWSTSNLNGPDIWRINTAASNSGERSWFVPNTVRSNDQLLQLRSAIELNATQPVLRFTHNYDIEPGLEGGIVEISTNGVGWVPADENLLFRESYVGRVAQNTFGIRRQKAFWGDSEDFITSYVDLNDFTDSDLRFRFRYSSDAEEGNNPPLTDGWFIDDIEIIDMANYASEVCVTSAEGDNVCAMPAGKGTIVETALATSTENILEDAFQVRIFPNPAQNQINVSLQGTSNQGVQIQLMSLDGKIIEEQLLAPGLIVENKFLNVAQLPRGMYFVKVQGEKVNKIEKIVVQ